MQATSKRNLADGITALARSQVSKVCRSHSSAFAARPGGVDRDLLGQVVERGLHDRGVGEPAPRRWAGPAEDAVGGVRGLLAVLVEEVVAGVVGREGLHAERVGERLDAVLGGADELAAALGDAAVRQVEPDDPAAHAVAGLQDDDRLAGGHQVAGGGEAGQAGADDHDVDRRVDRRRGRAGAGRGEGGGAGCRGRAAEE